MNIIFFTCTGEEEDDQVVNALASEFRVWLNADMLPQFYPWNLFLAEIKRGEVMRTETDVGRRRSDVLLNL